VDNLRGYLQIYTGNGKGKTTAAIGLTIRALGAGWKIFFGQFLKKGEYSELKVLKGFGSQVLIQQFGTGCFVRGKPSSQDYQAAQRGWEACSKALLSGEFQLCVFDELNLALHFKLLNLEEVLARLAARPAHVEVVVTGRYAPLELLEAADLVTEMREIKHYYRQGVKARLGIEK